jgi:monovalent cation/proton antiporter MnhG/PhaG subunit
VKDAVTIALLVVGVAAQLLACAGMLAMRDAFDRLHYTGPSMLAAVAFAAAVLVAEGPSLIADKAGLLALAIVLTSPVVVQAIGRAARIRERGSLDATGADVERAR